ncbi:MAG: tetratricopeptide repeat protein [Vicinamibacterales bacterium]
MDGRAGARPSATAGQSSVVDPALGPGVGRRLPSRAVAALVIVALAALVVGIYSPVRGYDFVALDDPRYVSENEHVAAGLEWDSIRWALTTDTGGYWIPLTWLSYMAEVEMFGTGASAHHVTNVLLHLVNAILLFILLRSMTGRQWESAFVAAAFAVHPLHVESVAWVTERKDVLSTFFTMLALLAHTGYARKAGWLRYTAVVVFFALGLAAKPMMVTLPLVLLLLDAWPLARAPVSFARDRRAWARLAIEKLPLLAIGIAASIVTFLATLRGGGVSTVEAVPLSLRFSNALVSYAAYIGKMFCPARLSPFYSLPDTIPGWQVAASAALLAVATVGVVWQAPRRPYLPVGWFWYLVTLLPVAGFVQAGLQARADRFTYVPLTGLFIVVAWGATELFARRKSSRLVLMFVATAAVVALSVAARAQLAHWKDSVTFWTRATQLTLGLERHQAHLALAEVLSAQGRLDEAAGHLAQAAELVPDDPAVRLRLAKVLADQGRTGEALSVLTETVRLRPDSAAAHNDLGFLLAAEGRTAEAARHYQEAIRLQPDLAEAQNNLGVILLDERRYPEATLRFQEAVRLRPSFELARLNLGVALARSGKIEEAAAEFKAVLEINPANEVARRAYAELKGRR